MAVAVITGTSTGIGLASAVAFGRAGYQTYATMRRPGASPELASIAKAEKLPIKIVTMDVNDDRSVSGAFSKILAEARSIDVLVNNAGIHAQGATEELPLSEFRRVMETNYFGTLRCLQAVLPGMRKQGSGHIVNVSTVGGRMCGLSQGPYSGSKYALEAISEVLAGEVKAFGIHVTIVEPGVFVTPIFGKMRDLPKNTLYPQERRMNAIYAASLKMGQAASVAAARIVEIVQSGTWQLRHPLGPDAEGLLKYRASITDEHWVDLHAIATDQEFAAAMKREVGMDLDL
jgi:NAD(P)-dependent dehydrogenase (short-subunit alcohol dehydrogenase family)